MSVLTQSFPFSARSHRTTDSPISWLMKLAVEDPAMLSLAAGFVDTSMLPEDLLRDAVAKVFASPEAGKNALQYGLTAGYGDLKREMAKRLEAAGIPNVDPACIAISNGGQQALYTITEAMVEPGDVVLVEDPTYFVYMDVLKSAGAHVLGVTTDDEGIVPESLEARFRELRESGLRDRLKILYVMSYFSNPKGCNMSLERRRRVWEIYKREADEHGLFMFLEDACYRDLCLDGAAEPYIKSFDPENEYIFTSGTFSKAFAPGLRLGWAYMPPALHTALCRLKGNQDFGSSNMNQVLMTHLLQSGAYEVAAERFRDQYRAKRDAMIAAIREFWPADVEILEPKGGLYVWARLPGFNTDPKSDFFNAVIEEKVLYVPGYYCFCDETQEPKPRDTMRLCYSYVDFEPMREAVRRMGKVITRMRAAG